MRNCVLKDEKSLHGHSWVTIGSKPVADTARSELLKTVYSYSSIYSPLADSGRKEIDRSRNVAMLDHA